MTNTSYSDFKAIVNIAIDNFFGKYTSGVPIPTSSQILNSTKIQTQKTNYPNDSNKNVVLVNDDGSHTILKMADALTKWNEGLCANKESYVNNWAYKLIEECEIMLNGMVETSVPGRTALEIMRNLLNSESPKTLDLHNLGGEQTKFLSPHCGSGVSPESMPKRVHGEATGIAVIPLPFLFQTQRFR